MTMTVSGQAPSDDVQEFEPASAGQGDVGENEFEGIAVQGSDGVGKGGDRLHVEALQAQQFAQRFEDDPVVVDDEDSGSGGGSSHDSSRPSDFAERSSGGVDRAVHRVALAATFQSGQRDSHAKHGSAVGIIGPGDGSVHVLDELLADGQPQPGSLSRRFGGVEGFEDFSRGSGRPGPVSATRMTT